MTKRNKTVKFQLMKQFVQHSAYANNFSEIKITILLAILHISSSLLYLVNQQILTHFHVALQNGLVIKYTIK